MKLGAVTLTSPSLTEPYIVWNTNNCSKRHEVFYLFTTYKIIIVDIGTYNDYLVCTELKNL